MFYCDVQYSVNVKFNSKFYDEKNHDVSSEASLESV